MSESHHVSEDDLRNELDSDAPPSLDARVEAIFAIRELYHETLEPGSYFRPMFRAVGGKRRLGDPEPDERGADVERGLVDMTPDDSH